MKIVLKYCFLTVVLLVGLVENACQRPSKTTSDNALYQNMSAKRIKLSNGWSLTPAGNKSLNLNDLPLNLVISPTGKYAAVSNNGQSAQSITLIDPATQTILDDAKTPKSYYGLAFSADETTLYASGGNDNKVLIYNIIDNKLKADGEIVLGKPWPVKISPVGLCLDDAQQKLFVVTKENNFLYVCSTRQKTIIDSVSLGYKGYGCQLSPDKKMLFVSLWEGSAVRILDAQTLKTLADVPTAKNPNDMLQTRDGKYLYVACGNDNTVMLIDIAEQQVVETLTASLYPDAPVGSTPNALALTPDESKLLIANADNNCLAVFDVTEKGRSRSLGFVPTGWYPTSIKVLNNQILITNGKGFSSAANPKGPNPNRSKSPQYKGGNPVANRDETQYIGGLFKGTLSFVDFPDERTLGVYSRLVYANTPYTKIKETLAEGEIGNPVPMRVGGGEKSPIKYVFYIVKENRTYDQVLGDMKEGNGDPSLCLFPEKITPNQHALAREFVLLDNFYVDAEVSADGHNWSAAAYANDYVEKNWVTSYGGRGGTYDYEGQKTIAFPRDGFIWDHAKRANVSYRTYGWFADGEQTGVPALEGHSCKEFEGYNLSYLDIDREKAWEKDFDELLKNNAVPRLNTIRLGNDHTSGARMGLPTPDAAVADNDLAVGRLVEHLSKSPIWNESVVFILEDDAQNGPDHVDAHRSTAFVAGGFVKRGFVDHTMYSTSGMLRTMELILGLKPMSQYDAAATPMWRCFQKTANPTPFKARDPGVNLTEKNVANNYNHRRTLPFDLSVPDAIDDLIFSEIVWQTVRGEKSKMPSPVRGAFVRLNNKDE